MSSSGIRRVSAVSSRPTPVGPGRSTLVALLAAGRRLDTRDPAVAQLAAGQLVSELFFKPVLAEMRSLEFGAEFASGGFAESVFAQQLDQRLADTLALSGGAGLVSQVAERLMARSGLEAGGAAVGTSCAAAGCVAGADGPAAQESCDEVA